MAASSKHYGDVVRWIEKVIDSCTTTTQVNGALNLIRNFVTVFPREYALSNPLWERGSKLFTELARKEANERNSVTQTDL